MWILIKETIIFIKLIFYKLTKNTPRGIKTYCLSLYEEQPILLKTLNGVKTFQKSPRILPGF